MANMTQVLIPGKIVKVLYTDDWFITGKLLSSDLASGDIEIQFNGEKARINTHNQNIRYVSLASE